MLRRHTAILDNLRELEQTVMNGSLVGIDYQKLNI